MAHAEISIKIIVDTALPSCTMHAAVLLGLQNVVLYVVALVVAGLSKYEIEALAPLLSALPV